MHRIHIQKMAAMILTLMVCFLQAAPAVLYADEPIDTPPQDSVPQEEEIAPESAVVITGDAEATVEVENAVNTNIIDIALASSTPEEPESSEPEDPTPPAPIPLLVAEESIEEATSTATSTIVNENSATTTNTVESLAESGDNTASGSGGSAVSTGDAIAQATVLNIVNTNIVNSNGLLSFLNLFDSSFDLRSLDLSYFFGDVGKSGACSLAACAGEYVISNTNEATTTNDVIVRAHTGGNVASSTGDALIETGNAYASANVLNMINTNFVDSHYLLVALNNFGDFSGDLTLPNADFFERLLSRSDSTRLSVENENSAFVTSTTTAVADSGHNEAQGDGADIHTGNALSQATTFNQVNTNVTGGSSVYMLINVFGDWSGTIDGLPDGLTWARTPNGIVIMNEGGSGESGGDPLTVMNTNTAHLENDVEVYALTGDNKAASASGDAAISTGNAYASANTVNLVNTNVIGQNWMLAMFNIFGNWDGNLSFGHPDLWIGGVAETSNPTAPGARVAYHFTVSNNGDAAATNVVLKALFDETLLSFDHSDFDDEIGWNLGTIRPGETKDFVYRATAGHPSLGMSAAVPLMATLSSTEHDADENDNTEELSILIQQPDFGSVGQSPFELRPDVHMTKSASTAAAVASSTVDYTITITNEGDSAYRSLLTDTLRSPDGEVVYERSWDLGEIPNGEEITIDYTVAFGTDTMPGTYTNEARLTAEANNAGPEYERHITPVEASATVEILPLPQVLGASTARACTPLLNAYLAQGTENDPEQVSLLQHFLKESENESALTISGVYDDATKAAVMRFQSKYSVETLDPWGIAKPTGVVYFTTQWKINELACEGPQAFALSHDQLAEIRSYRSFALGGSTRVASKGVEPERLEKRTVLWMRNSVSPHFELFHTVGDEHEASSDISLLERMRFQLLDEVLSFAEAADR